MLEWDDFEILIEVCWTFISAFWKSGKTFFFVAEDTNNATFGAERSGTNLESP